VLERDAGDRPMIAPLARLVSGPISQDEVVRGLTSPERGAVVVFSAVVRSHGSGRAVTAVTYDAEAPVAVRAMEEMGQEAVARFGPDLGVVLLHRIGRLEVGEACLVVGAASVHREEAFDAARWLLEQWKLRKPVPKREHFADERPPAARCRGLRATVT
jgi:molybdopterin synthase catalytic subunit